MDEIGRKKYIDESIKLSQQYANHFGYNSYDAMPAIRKLGFMIPLAVDAMKTVGFKSDLFCNLYGNADMFLSFYYYCDCILEDAWQEKGLIDEDKCNDLSFELMNTYLPIACSIVLGISKDDFYSCFDRDCGIDIGKAQKNIMTVSYVISAIFANSLTNFRVLN